MNKVCISILNSHLENKFKIGALWFVFKFFCYQIFHKNGSGGGQKRAKIVRIVRAGSDSSNIYFL